LAPERAARREGTLLGMMINRDPSDPRLTPISLRKELLGEGLHDRIIAGLIANGALVRVRHGAYVNGAAWRACDDAGRHAIRTRAVLKQARAELVASHLSAANEWDVPLWDLDLATVHTIRLDHKPGRRREAGIVQHIGEVREGDIIEMNDVQLTAATRTTVDCMTIFDVEHGVTTLNDMLHRKLTTLTEIDACIEFMEQWPGTLAHRVVRRLATEKPESVGENRSWFLFWRQGLPLPEPQYEIRDEHGNVIARVDFAWPELRVFVEFDGRIKYEPASDGESPTAIVLREKRREERICEMTGWRCIRITWADLYHPERTAARIRAAFSPVVAAG